MNLPLGAIALVVAGLALRLPRRRARARIDYLGASLLSTGIVAMALVAFAVAWLVQQVPLRGAEPATPERELAPASGVAQI